MTRAKNSRASIFRAWGRARWGRRERFWERIEHERRLWSIAIGKGSRGIEACSERPFRECSFRQRGSGRNRRWRSHSSPMRARGECVRLTKGLLTAADGALDGGRALLPSDGRDRAPAPNGRGHSNRLENKEHGHADEIALLPRKSVLTETIPGRKPSSSKAAAFMSSLIVSQAQRESSPRSSR